jgi:hypothetical protein
MRCNPTLDIATSRVQRRTGLTNIEMAEEEFLYEMLKRLGVNVSELRKMNPTEKQLEGLYKGLDKIIRDWTSHQNESNPQNQ